MPKLKLPDIEKVVAIDIHTHAEEPCGMHGDDGYDDFQERMAEYFKSPHKHPPTVPETAAYYRSKNIAAVIFPVDAERETGFRRYNNYEMLEVASDNTAARQLYAAAGFVTVGRRPRYYRRSDETVDALLLRCRVTSESPEV